MASGNLVRDIKTGRRALLEAVAVIEDDEDESKADAAFDAETKKSRFGPGGDAAIRHANAVRKAAANAKQRGSDFIDKIKNSPFAKGATGIAQSTIDAVNKGSGFAGGSSNVLGRIKGKTGQTDEAGREMKKLNDDDLKRIIKLDANMADKSETEINDIVKDIRKADPRRLGDMLDTIVRKAEKDAKGGSEDQIKKQEAMRKLKQDLKKAGHENLASKLSGKKDDMTWDDLKSESAAKIDAALQEMLAERRGNNNNLQETASAGASCAGGIAASFSSGGSGAFGPGFAQTKGERDDVLRRVAPGPERKTRKGNNGRKAGKIDYGV